MKHRITTDSLAREFRLLRNRIEAEVHGPAVLLVTSATEGDGASLIAFGIAESLSKTNQRTVLVTTHPPKRVSDSEWTPPTAVPLRRREGDRVEAMRHPEGDGRLSLVSISPERLATISRDGVSRMVQGLRADRDYVVIDAGDLPNNSFGLLLASSADAILVGFRAGRAEQPGDRALLDTLERSEAKVLGVVMTDQTTIDHFQSQTADTRDVPVPAPTPALERRAVSMNSIGKGA